MPFLIYSKESLEEVNGMQSEMLTALGLAHRIGGAMYNFRSNMIGEAKIQDEIQKLIKEFKAPVKQYYLGNQVHGNHVQYIAEGEPTPFAGGYLFKNTDGLLTDQKGKALIIKFADCTPILLYDPVRKIQANVHSGWRSTVKKISAEAIWQMIGKHGCKTHDIYAYIGPTIAQEDYEVGIEVYDAFSHFDWRDRCFKAKSNGKFLLNLSMANLLSLEDLGLNKEHIQVSTHTTYHDPILHSARVEGANYGLNAIVSMMI